MLVAPVVVVLGQAELPPQRHSLFSTKPLMLGKERSVRAALCSPPLPTQRCSVRSGGVCHTPKKAFFLLARDGRQPGQAAQLVLAPSDTHSSVARLSLCWSMCRHCHQNTLQGCPGSCHLPVPANPHPRGSSLPSNRCQCLQARSG